VLLPTPSTTWALVKTKATSGVGVSNIKPLPCPDSPITRTTEGRAVSKILDNVRVGLGIGVGVGVGVGGAVGVKNDQSIVGRVNGIIVGTGVKNDQSIVGAGVGVGVGVGTAVAVGTGLGVGVGYGV